MEIPEFLEHLSSLPGYRGQMVHVERLSPREPRFGDLSTPLAPALQGVLDAAGVGRLYSHQAAAIEAARRGEHVIVATGTSSGKTLCYNIPVLEALLAEPLSRALYLFPTKVLAQDQARALNELLPAAPAARAAVFDGDTPAGSRAEIRRRATVLLSNPDMLHRTILPQHARWGEFFRHLRYVVLDEAHVYRGVFGSHVACLLRRLQRVCALHGAAPQFLLCSATLANPAQHAASLLGQRATVIGEDGAPQGERHFVLWNPPLEDAATGRRASLNVETAELLAEAARCGLRTIAFGRTRKVAELLFIYAQGKLRKDRPELAERLSAYRGGYLAAERREIERRLFAGELLGVAATSALELGIDVGTIDATLQAGFPGTLASTRQQAGRAGRGRRPALNVLLGGEDPLDQYYMTHPRELFDRVHEAALTNPQNPYILAGHLLCAAWEAPLDDADEALFGPAYPPTRDSLEAEGRLQARGDRWHLAANDPPAREVNIRGTSGDRFLVLNEADDYRVMEEIDAETAYYRVHPGAIHLHLGEPYLITALDQEARVAFARPTSGDTYTQPLEANDVHIVRSLEARQAGGITLFLGQLRVWQQVVGYRRRLQFTGETVAMEPLDLPAQEYVTEGLWFHVPPEIEAEVTSLGLDLAGGLHAVEHACIGMLPLFAMCDRDDIGGLSSPAHPDTGQAHVFIYDGHPGGVGIARQGFAVVEDLWRRTRDLVRGCPCTEGCPACVQSPKCGSNNTPLDKAAAVHILTRLLGE